MCVRVYTHTDRPGADMYTHTHTHTRFVISGNGGGKTALRCSRAGAEH